MPDLFSKNKKTNDNMRLGNLTVLSALQLLLRLLKSGNSQSIDTAAEFEFLLNHRHDSNDTSYEIKELIDNISKNIPKNMEPQLKNKIDYICKTFEAACQQNSPSPRPTGPRV